MPSKEMSTTKMHFRSDTGEYMEMKPGGAIELTVEQENEESDKCISLSSSMTATFEILEDVKRSFISIMCQYSCNNWRKMHGLPLIRRRGMRK